MGSRTVHPAPLDGAVALVTGSGRGLGHMIAEKLVGLGASVAVHDISEEAPAQYGESASLSEVAERLARDRARAMGVTGDITDEAAVSRMVGQVEAGLGPISILVNCAGGDIGAAGTKPEPNGALDISLADAMAVLQRNFIGTMLMCRAVAPGMAARNRGAIINFGSLNGHQGVSPEVVYGCAKAAIIHYTRCLALEMRPSGVRVNAVSPGPAKTARFLATRDADPRMMQEGPSLDRYATPAEIADVVVFLASEESRFMSGQILRIDGGTTLFPG
ncbi:SDR family NAD(P)-dependent oxidoreductase [Sphingobium aquiterrae]|uniref:SDR family NAD(P)-dependent oxidoreductase n=1 Tax=Sphingobium aquiterrae TaxID=2038656 RepID=UPI003017A588